MGRSILAHAPASGRGDGHQVVERCAQRTPLDRDLRLGELLHDLDALVVEPPEELGQVRIASPSMSWMTTVQSCAATSAMARVHPAIGLLPVARDAVPEDAGVVAAPQVLQDPRAEHAAVEDAAAGVGPEEPVRVGEVADPLLRRLDLLRGSAGSSLVPNRTVWVVVWLPTQWPSTCRALGAGATGRTRAGSRR